MRLRGKQLDAINAALKSGTAEDFNAALQKTCAQAEGIGQFAAAPGSVEWPDIGKDPLKYRDEVKGGVEGAMERLGQASAVQQKGVPDQTALVWRIDLDRIRCELIVMTARWNNRPKNEAPPNDQIRRVAD